MNRTLEQTKEICERLRNEDGEIKRKAKDYNDRKGVTFDPMSDIDTPAYQVLHGMLNCGSVFFKTCVHLSAGVKKWVESPTDRSYPFIVATKENIQKDIKDDASK